MRQGRSLMRDASSSGHGNNSTEIVTDVRICHPIFKSRSFQRFFFFRISLSLDEIRYYRVFFLRGERGSRVIGRIVNLVCR